MKSPNTCVNTHVLFTAEPWLHRAESEKTEDLSRQNIIYYRACLVFGTFVTINYCGASKESIFPSKVDDINLT